MKKILFFVLIAQFLTAQSPDLLNTDWRITKIVTELGPDQFPPNAPVPNITRFSETTPNFYSTFYNSVGGDLTYNGNNGFNVNSRSCTLAQYMDDNGEVDQFFNGICAFFGNQGVFNYYIQNNGYQKTMIISNSIFQEIHFMSAILSTKDKVSSEFSLAPNPVKNTLTVKNSNGINAFQIFDVSGKLVLEQKYENTKTLNIDLKKLKNGTYLIKLNNDKSYKIIKE